MNWSISGPLIEQEIPVKKVSTIERTGSGLRYVFTDSYVNVYKPLGCLMTMPDSSVSQCRWIWYLQTNWWLLSRNVRICCISGPLDWNSYPHMYWLETFSWAYCKRNIVDLITALVTTVITIPGISLSEVVCASLSLFQVLHIYRLILAVSRTGMFDLPGSRLGNGTCRNVT
jgi:hypothetical protein